VDFDDAGAVARRQGTRVQDGWLKIAIVYVAAYAGGTGAIGLFGIECAGLRIKSAMTTLLARNDNSIFRQPFTGMGGTRLRRMNCAPSKRTP
jgi:hypothetical protein